ncbi:DUF707 domain-containing protein [Paucibacter sp. AS339]|uniref:DUF707 domain-containing protein n=1 Tax=Paucibacter hankyongi TaxID=3133434 RepID=UPI00309ACA25
MKDLLVFVRAGHKSLHREWAYDRARVDVLVSSYVDGLQDPSVFRVVAGGYNKYSHFKDLVEDGSIVLSNYRYYFLVDDDIDIKWPLEDLADAMIQGPLDVAQPSLTWGSYHTFPFLLTNPLCSSREVGFVEVMCPVFSREAMARVLPTFALSKSTWGIDLAYCAQAKIAGLRLTVIDSLAVSHCKEINLTGGAWYAKLKADGVNPEGELTRIQAQYGELQKRTVDFSPKYFGLGLLAKLFERAKARLRRELSSRGCLPPVRRLPS